MSMEHSFLLDYVLQVLFYLKWTPTFTRQNKQIIPISHKNFKLKKAHIKFKIKTNQYAFNSFLNFKLKYSNNDLYEHKSIL